MRPRRKFVRALISCAAVSSIILILGACTSYFFLILNFLAPTPRRTMDALTCSFRSHARTKLDNMIFYSGPPSTKRNRTASTNDDRWPDIDKIPAQAAEDGAYARMEDLDFTRGFNDTGTGKLCLCCNRGSASPVSNGLSTAFPSRIETNSGPEDPSAGLLSAQTKMSPTTALYQLHDLDSVVGLGP